MLIGQKVVFWRKGRFFKRKIICTIVSEQKVGWTGDSYVYIKFPDGHKSPIYISDLKPYIEKKHRLFFKNLETNLSFFKKSLQKENNEKKKKIIEEKIKTIERII